MANEYSWKKTLRSQIPLLISKIVPPTLNFISNFKIYKKIDDNLYSYMKVLGALGSWLKKTDTKPVILIFLYTTFE